MASFANNQEFYNRIDETCAELRAIGLEADASEISNLLHKVPWTTATELFPALESVFQRLLQGAESTSIPERVRTDISSYIEAINHADLV